MYVSDLCLFHMTSSDARVGFGDASGELGYRIAHLVAEAEETDPLDLTPPLYDVVNLDALQSLFRAGSGGGRATFEYLDHRIVVDADGTVSLGD